MTEDAEGLRVLPDVQPQNGNALHIGDALHAVSCIRHAIPIGECDRHVSLRTGWHRTCNLWLRRLSTALHGHTNHNDAAAMQHLTSAT